MLSPIKTMFLHFPLRAYSTVVILVLISFFAYRAIKKRCESGALSRNRGITGWILINYLLFLLLLAVLGRRSLDYYRYNYDVLYSYRDVFVHGDTTLLMQIIANIAVFVPVGALMSLSAKRFGFLKGLILGTGLSLIIEILQLVLRCGVSETDDLISNVLGTLIGCFIALVIKLYIKNKTAEP